MRRFVNEVLFVSVEWGIVVIALVIAGSMTVYGCTNDETRVRSGFVLF